MIDILLATYNGEAFLQELLDSLIAQTDADWRLLVRDDGSTDGTLSILRSFAAAHPGRVKIVEDERGNIGVMANFSTLMEMSDAPYVMFCDQDDVWLPDKVVKTRQAMKRIESQCGSHRPLLVHCDLSVVDADLREIAPSFMRHQRFDPLRGRRLNRLLVQNIAPGCTMMINRALKRLALPVPAEAMMHDWWAILIAAALGAIHYIDEPLVLYRQHGTNVYGANKHTLRDRIFQVLRSPISLPLYFMHHIQINLGLTGRQAARFLEILGDQLTPTHRNLVSYYATISRRNYLARRIGALRWGFKLNNGFSTVIFFMSL